MTNSILYAVVGAAGGAAAVYFLIKGGIIPNPAPVVAARSSNFARAVPVRANAVASTIAPSQNYSKFRRTSYNGIVTNLNQPSQYARAGILARPSSQAFSDLAHADLIRVD